MPYDPKAQQALNTEHTIRPQPGDYWHEMYSPCFLVVWTDGERLEHLDVKIHRMSVDLDHWTWDTSKPAVQTTVEAFAARLRYNSSAMSHATWADVRPQAPKHAWAVTEALATRKKVAP